MIAGAILIFAGVVIWRVSAAFARYIEVQNYERQRFCLLVAQELDRLDKALKENEKAKEQQLIQPYKDLWQLRN